MLDYLFELLSETKIIIDSNENKIIINYKNNNIVIIY